MCRVIALLGFALLLLFPAISATAQIGPMRGPASSSAATAPAAAPDEQFAPLRWLAQQQRDAARGFRQLLVELRAEGHWHTLAAAVGLAFLYGVFHAAGPGHGKMIVISYFLAERARLRDGLWMGIRIALTHVAAALVIVLMLFLLFDGRPGPDFESAREVRLLAYAGMTALGLWFLLEAAERLRRGQALADCGHNHAAPHPAPTDRAGIETAQPPSPPTGAARWRARLTGILAGAVPCTGAIIVLIFCASNGLWLAGLLMVTAIAGGMALTMTGLGLLTLIARDRISRWADHHPPQGFSRFFIGLAGPAFVTLGGVFLLAMTL